LNKTICLTFDIEDWFQSENLREKFPPDSWDDCEFRVEENTKKILKLLDKYEIKATFFILGWIAERLPKLVKEIYSKGHEIASHGYRHIMNSELTREEIFIDIQRSKNLLESIINDKIYGYRAPTFSITEDVIDALKKHEFKYDSSYHPFSKNKRYGKIELEKDGYFYKKDKLLEIPLSVYKNNFFELPMAGGGYFRLYPYYFFKKIVNLYLRNNDFLIMYFHPWEFDPNQPKIKDIKFSYRFRHYVGLNSNYEKLDKLINYLMKKEIQFKRLGDLIVDE